MPAASQASWRWRRVCLALDELVEADPEHPGDELEEAKAPAFAALPEIGGERFGSLGRLVPAPVIFVAQRRREAFLVLAARDVACERLAGSDRGKHAAFGPGPLEAFDLLVGPARLRRRRRAQHDQELRGGERGLDLLAEVGAGRQVLLVAEDRASAVAARRRSRSACRQASAAPGTARARDAASRRVPCPYGCS